MKLAMIGLGRMGGNMVKRLMQGEHEVVAYDVIAHRVWLWRKRLKAYRQQAV